MNGRLQKRLFDKYPEIFKQKDLDMTQTCMCWGIDCGDGWYNIIDKVCETIMSWKRSDFPETPQFTQVKEKYGTLRIYYNGDDWIGGIVALAETLSQTTCEICGKEGKINQEDCWKSVRCDACRKAGL